MIKSDFRQSHFILYELVLPWCSVCTPRDDLTTAWHTPVTCEEPSDSEYSLWLASKQAQVELTQPTPSLPGIRSVLNSSIFKCVTSSSESTAKLKGGEGLGSRGTMSFSAGDFSGDPGPINFADAGTFFGKLRARNILDGKKIITHYYTVTNNGSGDVVEEVNTSTHFITGTQLSNGIFKLDAKDALKDIEAFSQQFPLPSEISLTADVDEITTLIPVSDGSQISVGSVFRIDSELFRVQYKAGNNITVFGRGSSLSNGDGTRVYDTNTGTHDADATVQPCYVMSKTPLQDVIRDLFLAARLDDSINYTQWADEITEWNANAFLYGVFSEPKEISELLNAKLKDYMIDMWLDQPSQKAVISAVTAWKNPNRIISEEDDLTDLKSKTTDNTRFSRALIYSSKRYQAESDETQNYSRLTLHTDTETESSDFYGTVKLKDFGFSNTLSTASAQILCARYVQRFSRTPKQIDFTMEEAKLSGTKLSDIIDIVSRDTQAPDGSILTNRDRCQVTRIQPVLNNIGRQYKVSALSYVPLIASNPGDELTIRLTGTLFDVNLFARAGAPNVPVDVTYIFDGCTIGSTANNVPSVRAGAFPAGSRINIICTNGTQWSARGGDGGSAATSYSAFIVNSGRAAILSTPTNGGNSYQSDSIETHIYLNYTPIAGETANSTLYAAGGGGAAGGAVAAIGDNSGTARSNTIIAGGGGSGIPAGNGNTSTYIDGFSLPNVTSNDGTFNDGGNGSKVSNGSVSVSVFNANTSASGGGNGGKSANGESATNLVATVSSSSGGITYAQNKTPIQQGGFAGGAFKGSNITVYNLAAQSGKLRDGNSDPYTLITS